MVKVRSGFWYSAERIFFFQTFFKQQITPAFAPTALCQRDVFIKVWSGWFQTNVVLVDTFKLWIYIFFLPVWLVLCLPSTGVLIHHSFFSENSHKYHHIFICTFFASSAGGAGLCLIYMTLLSPKVYKTEGKAHWGGRVVKQQDMMGNKSHWLPGGKRKLQIDEGGCWFRRRGL